MIIFVFVIQSEFTGWYGSGLWHELGTIEILVIPGQTSVRARHVTLLSWREWWEDITNLGWLTLCSPPQVENGCMLEDCPYWGGRCELFKDINNFAILASCWWYFYASLTQNSSNLCSFSAFSFNWRSNLLSCIAIEVLFHVLSLKKHAWWTWIFWILVWRLNYFRFFSQWRFISLPNILMNSSRCIIASLFVFSIKVIQIGAIRSTETCKLAFIIVVIIMLFQRGVWKIFVDKQSLGCTRR